MVDNIIYHNYDEETGVSVMELETPWGTFKRSVTVQEEDKDKANAWDGYRFAHYLCVADKFKAKGKAFIERSKGMEHAANVMTQSFLQKDNQIATEMYPYYVDAILDLRKQAKIAKREGKKYLAKAKDMKKNYLNYVDTIFTQREDFRKRVENHRAFQSKG